MDNVTVFERLKRNDLEEMIKLNLDKGMSLQDIKYAKLDEKHMFERNIMRQAAQVQNLKEQIAYIDWRLQGGNIKKRKKRKREDS